MALVTIQQLAERQPAFSEGALRWMIFNAKTNGLEASGCIVRPSHVRRVYIDEDKFLDFIRTHQDPWPNKSTTKEQR